MLANVAEQRLILNDSPTYARKQMMKTGWGYEIFERLFEPIQAVAYLNDRSMEHMLMLSIEI